jgi:ribosome-associated translation inhibitor RaiA
MQITFQAVHFTADQKLKDYISDKLQKLVKFYPKILQATVYLKLENSGQVKDKVIKNFFYINEKIKYLCIAFGKRSICSLKN